MDALDLPAAPPAGGPRTGEQILTLLRESYLSKGADLREASISAERTMLGLLVNRWLTEWGMSATGEPLYTTSSPHAAEVSVVIW